MDSTKVPSQFGSGIAEAWLVDLVADAITVYRGPGPDGYGDVITVPRGETLRPLLLPGVSITAVEILG